MDPADAADRPVYVGRFNIGVVSLNLPMILAGVAAALVSGLIAIKLMLLVVKKSRLKWFSLYLALLALTVLANQYLVHIW